MQRLENDAGHMFGGGIQAFQEGGVVQIGATEGVEHPTQGSVDLVEVDQQTGRIELWSGEGGLDAPIVLVRRFDRFRRPGSDDARL